MDSNLKGILIAVFRRRDGMKMKRREGEIEIGDQVPERKGRERRLSLDRDRPSREKADNEN